MVKYDEVLIAYMSMIQGIVTRLETNSFTLKVLAMTLAVAVLAFSGTTKQTSYIYLIAGYLPILVFWIMDANYLKLGRLFRRLFNFVRLGGSKEPFSMDINQFRGEEQSTFRVAFSWSVFPFYASILIAFSIITICFFDH